MAITKQEMEHLAKLSRLSISGETFEKLSHDMQGIVDMVDQLQALDLDDITDVIDTEKTNALREDVVIPSYPVEELLKNAPKVEAGGFAVPRVIE